MMAPYERVCQKQLNTFDKFATRATTVHETRLDVFGSLPTRSSV